MMTVKDAITIASQQLVKVSDTPRLEAEVLIGNLLQKSRAECLAYPEIELLFSQWEKLSDYMHRRLAGEPIAYILGEKEFWSLNLMVTPEVLIPRPETEMLVEWILDHFPKDEKLRVADLGTGSGAIAIAIASERPQWQIDAVDHSPEALKIAVMNAKKHGVDSVTFYLGNWCRALPQRHYHVIVANPPYIAEHDEHLKQLNYEPRTALVSGPSGLSDIKKIVYDAKSYLIDDGWLVLEHGFSQANEIICLMKKEGYEDIQGLNDLANLPRMIVGRRIE